MAQNRMDRRAMLGVMLASGLSGGLAQGCSSPSNDSQQKQGSEKLDLPAQEPRPVQIPAGYVGPMPFDSKPFAPAGAPPLRIGVPLESSVVGNWNTNKYSAWLEQRTGLKIEYQAISADNGDMTKVNAMIASGDLPDAFMSMPFSFNQIVLYGSQGVFVPLDAYIDQTKALKQMYVDYPDAATLTKAPDGHTYSLPAINDCRQCKVGSGRAWINKRFLEKLGLALPETTDAFRTTLQAFKRDDPTGKGDCVPFVGYKDESMDRFLMNPFLYNPGDPWLRVTDGAVTFVADTDEWREGLRFMRSLNSDGTLTEQAFTLTNESVRRLMDNPGHARVGVVRSWDWTAFMTVKTQPDARWHDYVAVPALKGPAGTRFAAFDYFEPYSRGNFVITRKCARPDLLMMWAEDQIELEATMRSNWGLPGRDWDWTDGKTTAINGKPSIWRQKVGGSEGAVPPNSAWAQMGVLYRSIDFRLEEEYDPKNPAFAAVVDQESVAKYEPYRQPKEWQLPPVVFDMSVAGRVADIGATIERLVKQAMAEFATGKRDIDNDGEWASYTNSLTKAGMSEYLSAYQKAFEKSPK